MNKKKIIFISDSYPPLNDATSVINSIICKNLSKNYYVEVLCPINAKKDSQELLSKNLKIKKLPAIFQNRRNLILKIIKFLSFATSLLFYLFLNPKKNSLFIIHSSPPILIPLIALLIKISRMLKIDLNNKFFIIIHDLYPDILLHFNSINNKNFLFKIIILIYKFSYKQFDIFLPCFESISKKLEYFYKINNKNIHTFTCWSLIPKEILKSHKIENTSKFNSNPNLIIMGNIGILHVEELLVRFIYNLLQIKTDINLQLYTRGRKSYEFFRKISILKNVHKKEILPHDQICNVFKCPIITIVSLSYETSLCAFPSRISTALSMGSPIIFISDKLNNNPISDFILKHKIGASIENVNVKKECLKTYSTIQSNFNFYSENAISCYEKYFSLDQNLYNLNNLIKNYS